MKTIIYTCFLENVNAMKKKKKNREGYIKGDLEFTSDDSDR